jgi:hypothetical protein
MGEGVITSTFGKVSLFKRLIGLDNTIDGQGSSQFHLKFE